MGGGKANALVAMANAILALDQAGIEVNIVSFEGGNAANAIPSASDAVIVIKNSDVDKANETLAELAKKFKDSTRPLRRATPSPTAFRMPLWRRPCPSELSSSLVMLMSTVPNNIHTLLATTEGTESSSNLGTVSITEDTVTFRCMMRSSSTYQTEQLTMANTALAEMGGFELNIPTTFASWPLKANNELATIAADSLQGDDR